MQLEYIKQECKGIFLGSESGAVGRILNAYFEMHPDEFEGIDTFTLRFNIVKLAKQQIWDPYVSENRALAEKCISVGVYIINEGQDISNFDEVDFRAIPSKWN